MKYRTLASVIRDMSLANIEEDVMHDRYMRAHGKKAQGSGMWTFTTKRIGDPSDNEIHIVTKNTTLTDAAKEAMKALNNKKIYVMEQTQMADINEQERLPTGVEMHYTHPDPKKKPTKSIHFSVSDAMRGQKEHEKQGYKLSHKKAVYAKEDMDFENAETIAEKKLTPAEMKKREDVAKAIERDQPKMAMDKKMAIATATAKRVSEDIESVDEANHMKVATDIETYAKKQGGIDKNDMMKVAAMLKRGDKAGATRYAKTLDTDPRDFLLGKMGLMREANHNDDVGSMSKRDFKRREMEHELGGEGGAKRKSSNSNSKVQGSPLLPGIRPYSGFKNEEVEQVDELKIGTLVRYATKAGKSGLSTGVEADRKRDMGDSEGAAASRQKSEKRYAGQKQAIHKINTRMKSGVNVGEEINLDEVRGGEDEPDKHIIMQLRSAQDLDGNREIRFRGGKTAKVPKKHIDKILKLHDHPSMKPVNKRVMRVTISKSPQHLSQFADQIKEDFVVEQMEQVFDYIMSNPSFQLYEAPYKVPSNYTAMMQKKKKQDVTQQMADKAKKDNITQSDKDKLGKLSAMMKKEATEKEIKMAKGVAFDKRYKGGNYTGAAKTIEKIRKGLSDHPSVKNALRRANENVGHSSDETKG